VIVSVDGPVVSTGSAGKASGDGSCWLMPST
jgi:hypothetical protein